VGVLDGFEARSETAPEYEGFLKAKDVAAAGGTIRAMVLGFGVAKLDDGEKPYVTLSYETAGKRRVAMALVLKRRNGSELATAARRLGGEDALKGVWVDLTLGSVDFRGRDVPTIDLRVIETQSKPKGA
jgi:hypothetical protein